MTYRGRHRAPRTWPRRLRDATFVIAACSVVLVAGVVAGAACFGAFIGVL